MNHNRIADDHIIDISQFHCPPNTAQLGEDCMQFFIQLS